MIVNTNIAYTSSILENTINSLITNFPFIKKEIIGYSVLGKPIYCLILGTGSKEVFYSGAIHANESIVSPILLKFIEDLCSAYSTNSSIYGYSASYIFNIAKFYIVPMVNPDGVDLVNNAILPTSPAYSQVKNIASNFPQIPFSSGWKANINGVDF